MDYVHLRKRRNEHAALARDFDTKSAKLFHHFSLYSFPLFCCSFTRLTNAIRKLEANSSFEQFQKHFGQHHITRLSVIEQVQCLLLSLHHSVQLQIDLFC